MKYFISVALVSLSSLMWQCKTADKASSLRETFSLEDTRLEEVPAGVTIPKDPAVSVRIADVKLDKDGQNGVVATDVPASPERTTAAAGFSLSDSDTTVTARTDSVDVTCRTVITKGGSATSDIAVHKEKMKDAWQACNHGTGDASVQSCIVNRDNYRPEGRMPISVCGAVTGQYVGAAQVIMINNDRTREGAVICRCFDPPLEAVPTYASSCGANTGPGQGRYSSCLQTGDEHATVTDACILRHALNMGGNTELFRNHKCASWGTAFNMEQFGAWLSYTPKEIQVQRDPVGLSSDTVEKWYGLEVLQVIPGTPAERAGLVAGDYVLGLHKYKVKSVDDFDYAMQSFVGQTSSPIKVVFGKLRDRNGSIWDYNATAQTFSMFSEEQDLDRRPDFPN